MMLRYTATVLLSALVLLPGVASGRQWNLPSSRVVTPQLLRYEFSSKTSRQPFNLMPAVVGLKGGESNQPAAEEEVTSATAEEIARGGSTSTLKKKKAQHQPQFVEQQHEVNLEAPNATVSADGSAEVAAVSSSEPTEEKTKPKGAIKKYLAKRKEEKYHKKLAKKLRNRNATNLRRKVMHASWGMLFASLNHWIPKEKFVPGMAVLSSATLLMELLRYRKGFGWMNEALHFVLGKALRKHEMDGKFTGSFYFFTGVTLTSALFPTTAATMGIMQLAIADPSASYFGRATRHIYWSRIESGLGGIGRNKGFLGFLGGAFFCVPFNCRMLSIAKWGADGIPGGTVSLAMASLALGMAAAFADLVVPTPALTMPKKIWGVKVPPLHLDDNFVVPIVSGYACTQIFKALGWDQNLELARFLFF